MAGETYKGGCFCGAVRYQARGEMRNLCHCHCESCRRSAGAPFVAWGTVYKKDFEIVVGQMTIHRSSDGVERGFCNACGSTLTYSNALREEDIDLTLVSLDNPEAVAPKRHIWTKDTLSWINPDPALPVHRTVPGKDDQ